jgi:hypothetical protein
MHGDRMIAFVAELGLGACYLIDNYTPDAFLERLR